MGETRRTGGWPWAGLVGRPLWLRRPAARPLSWRVDLPALAVLAAIGALFAWMRALVSTATSSGATS